MPPQHADATIRADMVINDRPSRRRRQGPSCLFVLFFLFSMVILLFVIQNRDEVLDVIIPTPTPEPTRSATEYALLAQLSYGDDELEEAIGFYEEAVRLDATRPQLYIDLMNLLVEARRPEEALAWAEDATLLANDNEDVWTAYAVAHLANGDRLNDTGDPTGAQLQYAEAVEKAQRALDLNPQNATAMAYVAGGLVSQGNPNLYEEAQIRAEEATIVEPNNPIARLYMALVFESLGLRENAREQWQLGIQSDPANAELHMGLAFNFYATSRVPDAILAFNDAIEVDPGNAAAYDGLAFMYLQLGQLPIAEENALIAIELDPSLARAHGRLGEAYFLQNNYQNAINALSTATTLYGDVTGANSRFFYYLGASYVRISQDNCAIAQPYFVEVSEVTNIFQEAALEELVECRRLGLEAEQQ
ncbi:MAG: tetratricopeptide repeat protein [Chloroflexota bacterium]